LFVAKCITNLYLILKGMAALNSGKQKEHFQYYSRVVKQAGIDQLQQDMVKVIQKKYLLTSEEEAIKIVNAYASTVQNIVAKHRQSVDVKPVSILAGSSAANTSPLAATVSMNDGEQERLQSQKPVDKNHEPVLYGCHNVVTNLRTVMSGSVMQLYGLNLDIDKLDSEQGVYLVDFAGKATKINTLVRVKSTNIIFMIPGSIAAGIYKLDIRKRTCVTDVIFSSLLPGFIRVVV
jgi:hypothetical protein